MSYFTQQFENERIDIATSIPARVNDSNNTLIVTSGKTYIKFYDKSEDTVILYTPDMVFHVQVRKEDLLKAIQQTPVYGKVDN